MTSYPFAALSLLLLMLGSTTTDAAPSAHTVHDFSAKSIAGKETPLKQYKGKVLLIVNTASKCGFTPQYEGLEALYQRYHDKGFEVLAFPANDFMGQEPGNDHEIQTFCTVKYKTTFPLFSKITVKGKGMHPLYQYLTRESGFNGDIPWNFTKFLVDANGKVVGRFDPMTTPDDERVTGAIDKLLAAH